MQIKATRTQKNKRQKSDSTTPSEKTTALPTITKNSDDNNDKEKTAFDTRGQRV